MKYNTVKVIDCGSNWNFYFPALNRYLLKEGIDYAYEFQEGFGVVKKDKKYNYVKPDGTYLLSEWVDGANNFNSGFGMVRKDRQYNYVRPDGTYLLNEWVDDVCSFREDFVNVRIGVRWYKVDKTGNLYEI